MKTKVNTTRYRLSATLTLLFLLFISVNLSAQVPPGADSMLNFISANPSRSAFTLHVNDTALSQLNENRLLPLASTVKILVAVEYAKQAGNGVIDHQGKVAISELEKYHIPDTDGGAQPGWLEYEREMGHVVNDSIELRHVARGMMMFSSNANTEYLMDLLGLDNINNNLPLFGLKQHTRLFPIVSSLFIYQNPRKLKEKQILRSIDQLTEEAYCKTAFEIHKALKYDSSLKRKFRTEDLSPAMQQLWSDRLPAGTTQEYTLVMALLNKRKFLDENSYGMLADVMEYPMENPGNRAFYRHLAWKGGSTATVLTFAAYATLRNDARIEAACFFNGLNPAENEQMAGWINDFLIGLTQSPGFRTKTALKLSALRSNR